MASKCNERLSGDMRELYQCILADIQHTKVTGSLPAAAYFLEKEFLKKYVGGEKNDTREKALASFVANNLLCAKTHQVDPQVISEAKHFAQLAFEKATLKYAKEPVPMAVDEDLLLDLCRYGPGAYNGGVGTHAAEKIGSVHTCTLAAYPWIYKVRTDCPYWQRFDAKPGANIELIKGSRITTVPKNNKIDRVIAIEPLGNMFLQLALGRYTELALRSVGLDIRYQQPRNRALAWCGSVGGGFSTIDLKAASDSISIALIKDILPPSVFSLVLQFRSRYASLPNGETIKLNMVSTMGNGFTFPIMTLVFASLLYGYRRKSGTTRRNRLDFGSSAVFGDDIIVRDHEYEDFVQILTSAGFTVNSEKSFSTGLFRESCGGYYYSGFDITPCRPQGLARGWRRYVTLNSLIDYSVRTGIILHRSIDYVKKLGDIVHVVPEWEAPDAGLRTPGCPRKYKALRPSTPRFTYSEFFTMPLAVGGYLNPGTTYKGRDDYMYFTKRSQCKSHTIKLRVPTGYSSGWDPFLGSHRMSELRSLLAG